MVRPLSVPPQAGQSAAGRAVVVKRIEGSPAMYAFHGSLYIKNAGYLVFHPSRRVQHVV